MVIKWGWYLLLAGVPGVTWMSAGGSANWCSFTAEEKKDEKKEESEESDDDMGFGLFD